MSWVSWEQAWTRALYGELGFYRAADGPAAHFATSAQGIPGGGPLLAAAVAALAREHGTRHVVDFAAGRGALATQLHLASPHLRVTAVDVVDRPAELPRDIAWLQSDGGSQVPPQLNDLGRVLVVAHEWLDVVPCQLLEHDGVGLRVVEVDDSGRERLGGPGDPDDVRWSQQNWPGWDQPSVRIEVGRARDAAYSALRSAIGDGVLVTVDYGHLRGGRPVGGTLIGYRRGAACAPRPDGSTDITAHVAMDTLGAPELIRQADLFERLGVRPQTAATDLARTDPRAYLTVLAARSAYAALTQQGGLGDFWWSIDPVAAAGSQLPAGRTDDRI